MWPFPVACSVSSLGFADCLGDVVVVCTLWMAELLVDERLDTVGFGRLPGGLAVDFRLQFVQAGLYFDETLVVTLLALVVSPAT